VESIALSNAGKHRFTRSDVSATDASVESETTSRASS